MPGAASGVDEAQQLAVAADEVVGGDAQVLDGRVVGVCGGVEGVGEELLDTGAAELIGGEADGVDDDQADGLSRGALVVVGGQRGQVFHLLICSLAFPAPGGWRAFRSLATIRLIEL